jgi:hypothetical protein
MQRGTVVSLVDVLRVNYLEDTRFISVKEVLAIFCLIVGHRQGMGVACDQFQHSIETISRHVKHVMRALCNLSKILIRPMQVVGVHPYVQDNPKYFPWFEV